MKPEKAIWCVDHRRCIDKDENELDCVCWGCKVKKSLRDEVVLLRENLKKACCAYCNTLTTVDEIVDHLKTCEKRPEYMKAEEFAKALVEAAQSGRRIGLAEAEAALEGEFECDCGPDYTPLLDDDDSDAHGDDCKLKWGKTWQNHFAMLGKKEWRP